MLIIDFCNKCYCVIPENIHTPPMDDSSNFKMDLLEN